MRHTYLNTVRGQAIARTDFSVEKTNTALSKLTFTVGENEKKGVAALAGAEQRLHAALAAERDDVARRLQEARSRLAHELDKLHAGDVVATPLTPSAPLPAPAYLTGPHAQRQEPPRPPL